jgi:hypothetical protein
VIPDVRETERHPITTGTVQSGQANQSAFVFRSISRSMLETTLSSIIHASASRTYSSACSAVSFVSFDRERSHSREPYRSPLTSRN